MSTASAYLRTADWSQPKSWDVHPIWPATQRLRTSWERSEEPADQDEVPELNEEGAARIVELLTKPAGKIPELAAALARTR